MRRTIKTACAVAVLALLNAGALLAQAPPAGGAPPPTGGAPPAGAHPTTPKAPFKEPKLVFDREVFTYSENGRRDPFKPLLGKESSGPLFDDLKLKGVIYSSDPRLSIALIVDGSKHTYRVHRGEVVGNSRVVDIQPLVVKFAVESFGTVRNEILELRPGTEPAEPPPSAATASGQIINNARNAAEAKRMLDSLNAARAKQQQPPPKQEDPR